ncbi:exodeoxyribonuclease V subunit gamma [Thiolapillus sp.]
MLNVYPSNRLEDLAQLLDAVLRTPKANLLQPDIVLVQNGGMQHWLNLRLAQQRGISMNLDFHLPASFFWRIIREILGREAVPDVSPYSREVLCWRLYGLLGDPSVTENPLCREPGEYWRNARGNAHSLRFQLARELADLFEQYLIYRPDWIKSWDRGETPHWQAFLWQQLVAGVPDHPLKLLQRAAREMPQATHRLPQRLFVFGVNALAPLWLDFLGTLGGYTQVHLFHLNPCVEYWGDVRSEKQLSRWLESNENSMDINPLLGNLGAQGREFLSLLQEQPATEFPVFDPPWQKDAPHSLLHHLQMDIFSLDDARRRPRELRDDSITLVSAHSALREVQALHDWLLHQFNGDETLVPADVLVTCPQIEDYAPAVQAVFGGMWEQADAQSPMLPCSIADRALRDEEPLVAAFAELLDLPDSRFQVSRILSLLRLPAVQKQFAIAEQSLPAIEGWLEHAAVHWGLDGDHRQQVLGMEGGSDSFTWKQGLERLLLGFAWGHEPAIHANRLLLPDVEGEEALLLGRLLQLIDGLKRYAHRLGLARKATAWQVLLLEMQRWLFGASAGEEAAQQIVVDAINELGEYPQAAGFDEEIPLCVIRDWLRAGFSRPEPGRRFLVGQVSFCSMIPMRSLPFRIIAVLGLNNGDFPRQRPPRGFDLMAQQPPRPGDRSLRGDDRYLFLETLISARDKLYLSYQGKDIKTNLAREPSLVLKELMDYLQQGYGWSLSGDARDLVQLPLQPFSAENYREKRGRKTAFRSFDSGWLSLLQRREESNQIVLPLVDENEKALPLEALLQFFSHPPRYFARRQLGLYLEADEAHGLEDHEPFCVNHLDRYLIQEQLVQSRLEGGEDREILLQARLGGRLPDTPIVEDALEDWARQAGIFAEQLAALGGAGMVMEDARIEIQGQELQADLPRAGGGLLFYRLASAKGKDDMRLWLHHLFAQCLPEAADGLVTRGIFRHENKADRFRQIMFRPVENAPAVLRELLEVWREGMRQPLLCGVDLGRQWIEVLAEDPGRFASFWADDYRRRGPGYDPYYRWFWPEAPDVQALPVRLLQRIYAPLYRHRQEEDL